MADYATSIQEAAAQFANTILGNINSAAADTVGVDVMWFRATPDKRNQDVIFQSYTLWGVEDCPLNFRVMYADSGYNDAAITYNIMGINFQVPMTMDIALNTWKNITNDDGTIPQQHDIVYVPMTRKLLEVMSMEPIKQIGGQLTGYKVNLEIYKPTRSRIVGENLKESIKNNTTNLDERFGDAIEETLKNIVDDNQLSLYTSTSEDSQKTVAKTKSENSGIFDIRNIISYNLMIDGHIAARNYYDMTSSDSIVVRYKRGDEFTIDDERYFSCWVNINDKKEPYPIKNIKGEMSVSYDDNFGYITVSTGTKFKKDDEVVLKRGKIIVPGTIENKNTIRINKQQLIKLNKMNSSWYKLPGFVLTIDNIINLLSGDDFGINIKDGNFISIKNKEKEELIQISSELKPSKWYGICVNISDTIKVDIYTQDTKLTNIFSSDELKNKITDEVSVQNYYLHSSDCKLTNIRLYNTTEKDIDKQLTDLVSYNVKNDSNCIINDSADTFLNKPYMGRQR